MDVFIWIGANNTVSGKQSKFSFRLHNKKPTLFVDKKNYRTGKILI